MAINAAQRTVFQRSTDAAGFSAALQGMLAFATPEETERLLDATAAAVYQSIVNGSPITNAPGQPVDTGELRDSWEIKRISKDRREISTTSPYARAIEHNWRRIARAQMKKAGEAMGFKRLTRKAKALIRKRFGGINFRGRGGSHSVALTARHFPQIVAVVVAQLYPHIGRNIGASVQAKGVGINVGTRTGAR